MGKKWDPKIWDGDICADTDETETLNAQILVNLPEYPATPFPEGWIKTLQGPRQENLIFSRIHIHYAHCFQILKEG